MSILNGHSPEFISVINDLGIVSDMILITNAKGKVTIKQTNKHESVFVEVNADASVLPLVGDQGRWAFTNYGEFYAIYKAIGDNAVISEIQDGVVLEVSNASSKFTYRLSAPKRIRGVWTELDNPSWDIQIPFDKKTLQTFRQAIGLINADKIRISVTPNNPQQLLFTATPDSGENSWDYVIELEEPMKTCFAYTLPLEPFTKIPLLDYTLSVSVEDLIRFEYQSDLYNLTAYGLTIATEDDR